MLKMVRLKYEFAKLSLGLKKLLGIIDRKQYRLERKALKGRLLLKHSYHSGDVLRTDGIGIAVDLGGFNSLSEVGRNLIDMLKKTNIPFEVFDTGKTKLKPGELDLGKPYRDLCSDILHYKKKIICTVAECYKEPEYDNFITPFWEFESGVKEARPALFEGCQGIITLSDFCYQYFKKEAPKGMPVYKVRYPFVKHWKIVKTPDEVRTALGLKKSDYVVFFHFDYNSCYERKNPEAVLRAFAAAFATNPSARLVIKTNGFEKNQDKVQKLEKLAEKLSITAQTLFINEHMTKDDLMSLINATDVYISLHRGEGFGLGMLEAMALSKPVIATNYGGNTEFMNKNNSLLVDYGWMHPENLHYKSYQAVEKWADPNIDQAATYLKDLYKNKEKELELGQKAKNFVNSYFNIQDFEQDMQKFLSGGNK